MKRYEAPVVELTKFDIEDVITASGDVTTPIDAATTYANGGAAAELDNIKTDANNNNYTGGIFAW